MVFFSYRTKYESPAGNQFWTFSRQCSIFGRIGYQWVAISSPATFQEIPYVLQGERSPWQQLASTDHTGSAMVERILNWGGGGITGERQRH